MQTCFGLKAPSRYDTQGSGRHRSPHEVALPQIYVCPLAHIPNTVRTSGARTLLTLINKGTRVPRPKEIAPERHRFVAMSDIIVAQDGHILPNEDHVAEVLAVARAWDQTEPLLIHCWAGVSRSTAAAYISACALSADRCEFELARTLRERSPTATPNALMVRVADRLLGREGRMIEAVAAIGRGAECMEGVPFALDLATPSSVTQTEARPA
jgi:predicted protein tyrosine phosphatase